MMLVLTAQAQSTFTQYVKLQNAGDGKVTISQDTLIDNVVNNKRTDKPTTANKQDLRKKDTEKNPPSGRDEDMPHREYPGLQDPNSPHLQVGRQRYKAQGYRIQIFTGSNSHKDKAQAYAVGTKCQKEFPMLSAYPRFVSPRWICRVGDFKTHEEAEEYVEKIRAARISTEVRIVKSEVLLAK